jgi:hypothetical protein
VQDSKAEVSRHSVQRHSMLGRSQEAVPDPTAGRQQCCLERMPLVPIEKAL